jgi:hypothetical protein
MLLLLRVGPDPNYVTDVVPGTATVGLGLCLTVAPLTATVFDAAPDRHAGIASGVNNAVARAAGLLAVAVVPALAGISGADYTNPAAFDDGFRAAMGIAAGLVASGGLLSLAFLRASAPAAPDLVDPVDVLGGQGRDGERADG